MSNIEWTGKTWNPVSGCSRKSDGCKNCYAEVMTKRLAAMGNEKYAGLLNDQNRFNGVIKFDEKALLMPLSIKKPTTFFVNSMSDLFHENVKDEWIDKVFAVMALCPQHTFQILTKRADRMRNYCQRQISEPFDSFHDQVPKILDAFWKVGDRTRTFRTAPGIFPLPNVWLAVSVENQKAADERIPCLLQTPAAVRFLSCEPLLEEIDIFPYLCLKSNERGEIAPESDVLGYDLPGIGWVIVGGESGGNSRKCEVSWIRSVVMQCQYSNVPVFVKQMGANSTLGGTKYLRIKNRKGAEISEFPADLQIREYPKVNSVIHDGESK